MHNKIDTAGLGVINEYYGSDGKSTIVRKNLSDDIDILEKAFDYFNNLFFEGKLETPVISISSNMRRMVKATKPDDWVKHENGVGDRTEECIGLQFSEKVLTLDIVNIYVQLLIGMIFQYDIEKKEAYIAEVGSEKGYKPLTQREGNYYSAKFVDMCKQCMLSVENYDKKKGRGDIVATEEFRNMISDAGLDQYKITCNRQIQKNDGKNEQSMRVCVCPKCNCRIRVTKDGLKFGCYNNCCQGTIMEYEKKRTE